MPVLSGILVNAAASGSVELASTDMELSLRLVFTAKVEKEGAVVVPGRLICDVVRSLPEGDVRVSVDEEEQMLRLTSGQASFKINYLPAADFPKLAEMPQDGIFEVAADPLKSVINTVARAASRDETRPVLTGILVRFGKDSIKMVATDSYRLSVKETKVESTLAEKKEVIVPRSSMEELAKLLDRAEPSNPEVQREGQGPATVKVGLSDGQILFLVGETLLASRLIEGQFPNYSQLLPDEFKYEAQIDKEELLEVVGRVGLMAQKNAPLRMKFEDSQLTVSAKTPEVGEARESLPVNICTTEGQDLREEEIEVGFNTHFLKDGIESVDEEMVFLRIISPLKPGLIKGRADDFLYLVMPVRLTS
jgi:DNA polymerase-3 subunit beta